MAKHLEPTYLRYIYDGLINGSIHPENAAELPDGLIGLYEEAFEERTSVLERQKLLQRIAIWSLLKKEVSAAFVAEVLGDTENEIQEFISTYSTWFNSPESGKYQLYHERLKVFLLQKMSEGEVHMLHEKLIYRLESAIEQQKSDEFEWYGLEFLTSHLAVSTMLNGDGKKLIELAYSQTHWQRQLKISRGYSWTSNGLKEVMNWATKHDDDEVIECSLQMVDLHLQEQNAAPQIVALVAEGDFDTALKRIEQFGGSDKEGLQRKFILYMLCLMELTLLKSKEKPFRKEGIEKLLKHLDNQFPLDLKGFKWWGFGGCFSDFLLFRMAFIWEELDLDYLIVFNRTNDWDYLWINNSNIIRAKSLKVLLNCTKLLPEKQKDEAHKTISIQLAKNRSFRAAIKSANLILNNSLKSEAFLEISSELKKNKKEILSNIILNDAIKFGLYVDGAIPKIRVLTSISNYLISIGKNEDAKSYTNKAFRTLDEITDFQQKGISLSIISTNFEKLGWKKKSNQLIQQAIENSNRVNSRIKVRILRFIAKELEIQGKNKKLNSVIKDAIDSALNISADVPKYSAMSELSIGLLKLGHFEKSKSLAYDINSIWDKGRALKEISLNLAIRGRIDEATIIAEEIKENIFKLESISNIVVEKIKAGNYIDTNDLAQRLDNKNIFKLCEFLYQKNRLSEFCSLIIKTLSHETTFYNSSRVKIISNLSKHKTLESDFLDAIKITRCIDSNYNDTKSKLFASISLALFEQGEIKQSRLIIEESIQCALEMSSPMHVYNILIYIANQLVKQGNIELVMEVINHIQSKSQKVKALSSISTSLFIGGNFELSNQLIIEAKEITLKHPDASYKDLSLIELSIELTKQEMYEESASMIRLINNKYEKCKALAAVSGILRLKGENVLSLQKYAEILDIYQSLGDDSKEKSRVCHILSKELIYGGHFEKAKCYINEIKNDELQNSAFYVLIEYLFANHQFHEVEQILMQFKNLIEKQKILQTLVKHIYEKSGFNQAISYLTFFKFEELRLIWSIELYKNLSITEYNKGIIVSIIKTEAIGLKNLSDFLQKYALHELFCNKLSTNILNRYNRLFNIQWAIDIKNQMN